MAGIELERVGLTFKVRHANGLTLKEYVLRQMFKRRRTPPLVVEALRDLNFSARDGDRIGVVGHNGAGKSTLLKLLAGVYAPSCGRREVRGQISSLFDIALGFETEASGWENIRYRAYLQGETPASLRDKIQPIAEFSELGKFLDMPVRYYSAGMHVRLAFSIATAIDPEILLVDEVLSVGDLSFQEKARQRMRDMMSRAKIIIMVSHDLHSLASLCEQAIWMDHGTIRKIGPARQIVDEYYAHYHLPAVAA